MADTNIPLMNGQRLETTQRTVGGVPIHRPHYRPTDSADPIEILVAALELDGAGATAMSVDGSSAAKKFSLIAAADQVTVVRVLSMVIADDGALVAGGFGGLAALTNGLAIEILDTDGTSVLADLTAGFAIKTHADLIALGAAVEFVATAAALVAVRWTFATAIELAEDQRLQVTVRDNLTGLTDARAAVTGHVRTLP